MESQSFIYSLTDALVSCFFFKY